MGGSLSRCSSRITRYSQSDNPCLPARVISCGVSRDTVVVPVKNPARPVGPMSLVIESSSIWRSVSLVAARLVYMTSAGAGGVSVSEALSVCRERVAQRPEQRLRIDWAGHDPRVARRSSFPLVLLAEIEH